MAGSGHGMKIVHQGGARHCLTRKDAEAIVGVIPEAWSRVVKSVILYQGAGAAVYARYYPQIRSLGLFWPEGLAISSRQSKEDAIEELLVSLAYVCDTGSLPNRITRAKRLAYSQTITPMKEECLRRVSRDATSPKDL
jgi:hypothetical protein